MTISNERLKYLGITAKSGLAGVLDLLPDTLKGPGPIPVAWTYCYAAVNNLLLELEINAGVPLTSFGSTGGPLPLEEPQS